MDALVQGRPTVVRRGIARRLSYWNGALWAIGNGLVSSTLIVYPAMDLGAPRIGLGVGLIKAAPQLAGLLRLGTPLLIRRLGDRKRFCLVMYFASGLMLFALPWTAAGWIASKGMALTAIVGLWCLYHLLEYLATVALWSWLADLVPQPVRGRFIGRRERWMVAGNAGAMLAAGLFTWGWHALHPEMPRWIGYAIPAVLGAWLLMAAVVPLALMPAVEAWQPARAGVALRSILAPFADRRFLRLLAFGSWFSFFNGLTQSAQYMYPYRVLGMSLFVILALQTLMRCGQWLLSPTLGRLADRLGNRPIMMMAVPVVASGLLFYLLATPERPWWLVGAWVAWVAYAGLNVCLPSLLLKLSPRQSDTPYIAAYFAVTGLCVAVSMTFGGWALDWLALNWPRLGQSAWGLDYYQFAFLFGWITRTLGLLFLLTIIEPASGEVGINRAVGHLAVGTRPG